MGCCDVKYDRSHTYLIEWLPPAPEVNVILRRSRHASRDKRPGTFYHVMRAATYAE